MGTFFFNHVILDGYDCTYLSDSDYDACAFFYRYAFYLYLSEVAVQVCWALYLFPSHTMLFTESPTADIDCLRACYLRVVYFFVCFFCNNVNSAWLCMCCHCIDSGPIWSSSACVPSEFGSLPGLHPNKKRLDQ